MSRLDIPTVVEGIAERLSPMGDEKCRWKVCSTLKITKTVKLNVPLAELRAISQLRKGLSVKILPADKENASVVTDSEQYNVTTPLISCGLFLAD
jgi:hypothetical protein